MRQIRKLDLVAVYARITRTSYISHKTNHELAKTGVPSYSLAGMWDGKKDRAGKKRRPIWPNIARFMLRNALDPDACISARFRKIRDTNKDVKPNQIASAAWLQFYKAACDVDGREFAIQLRSEKQLCEMGIEEAREDGHSGKEAWLMALLDDGLAISPLFRVCLADSEGLDRVVSYYVTEAMVQYLAAPEAYDEHWCEWIPQDFKDEVLHARDRAIVRQRGKEVLSGRTVED